MQVLRQRAPEQSGKSIRPQCAAVGGLPWMILDAYLGLGAQKQKSNLGSTVDAGEDSRQGHQCTSVWLSQKQL